jgi:putative addiction module component (TIGR02574 family)
MPNLEPAVLAEMEALYERAMKLPADAVSILADRLAPTFPADTELQAELQRRWDEFEKGNAKTYTHEEVMSALQQTVEETTPKFPADPELQAELQRRWDAFVADPSRAIPGDVFFARLRSRKKSGVRA